jgi:uncharacterized protein YkwD
MKKPILVFALAVLVCAIAYASTNTTKPSPAPTDAYAQLTKEEAKFVDLANKERVSRGLSKLTVDPLLIKVARAHSQEMADKNYFSHDSPTPGMKTALDRYLAAIKTKPTWALVGENLYYCSKVDCEGGHCALMNSPHHRENILEPKYQRIGLGAVITPKGEFYVTQMFLAQTD